MLQSLVLTLTEMYFSELGVNSLKHINTIIPATWREKETLDFKTGKKERKFACSQHGLYNLFGEMVGPENAKHDCSHRLAQTGNERPLESLPLTVGRVEYGSSHCHPLWYIMCGNGQNERKSHSSAFQTGHEHCTALRKVVQRNSKRRVNSQEKEMLFFFLAPLFLPFAPVFRVKSARFWFWNEIHDCCKEEHAKEELYSPLISAKKKQKRNE